MIQQYLSRLAKRHIVLASGSPRRKQILEDINLAVNVIPSTFEENLKIEEFSSIAEYVIETARYKAIEVWERLKNNETKADLVIGADTVVVLDNEVFGKPKDKDNAVKMLEKLNGKTHKVITGVALVLPDQAKANDGFEIKTFHEITEVDICHLTPEIIKAYVETGEPLDKAGGYAIQGIGGSLIRKISGDYFNVVGFPLNKFCQEVHKLCVENVLQC